MKTPFAALLTFALLTTSNAAYQCLDSAPNLYCCQNHPFACQIRASPFSTYLSPPFRQLQLTASSITVVRDPGQDPSKPPGASYQPADLNAFAAACTRLNGASWPACCYVDAAITSCNRAFNTKNRRQNRKIANWGTLDGYATELPQGYQTQAPKY
ncbi:hypothetical protein VE01_03630 [Pseudogymnoascus verrucosus]|uniref:Hydrophobin n=1 Tax=Pseudogymnoascus verrucosus TaxID=342668 RepID=A0A1B8GRW2_9PEZI|nr:uncharacterized protein VE01_03630 [Pseudogymnoascus verrucosus]OBT98555.1 hypothetical protein VE01_03630 [Pseudogymnoascus verrucosus]